jgi:hypothetical protein
VGIFSGKEVLLVRDGSAFCPGEGASPEFAGRMVPINRIYGGGEKPEGLIHTLAQGERSVALGKDVHFANPERVQQRVVQEGKGRDLLCPFRARRVTARLPRATLRLPWASVCGILSGFFLARTFWCLSRVSMCRTASGDSNFSEPSHEFGGCTLRVRGVHIGVAILPCRVFCVFLRLGKSGRFA